LSKRNGPRKQSFIAYVIDGRDASFHEKLLDSLYDGVYFVDAERKITYWNKGAEQLTGYTAQEAVGKHCFDNFLVHVNDEGCVLCHEGCPLQQTIRDGARREAEVYLRHKLGHRIPILVRVAPMTNGQGQILGAVEVFSDVSAKKRIERRAGELARLALQDALTGVPNRRYLELKVKQALQEFEQFGRVSGLLMIDVDHFKRVNDQYGHDAGDCVLRSVCNTLTHSLRPTDIVGRWGGEEFLVILTDASSSSLESLGERCRKLIGESGVLHGHARIDVTVSVGATLTRNGDTHQSLVKRADELMYCSKTNGRNRTTVG
jgi:diguanylate cyclase (GGDEF)-like protein/PAS domain S-box-containing protein